MKATSRASPTVLTTGRWPATFASADAFVHAGTHETFGLVVVEAMACGRPVVGMRAGALPELVDVAAGRLAEPHPDPAVAAAHLADPIVQRVQTRRRRARRRRAPPRAR